MKRISIGVLPIQTAVATASPKSWQDGLVSSAEQWGVSVTFIDGRTVPLASEAKLAIGEPVAWHPVAEVLANGRAWFSARLVEA